MLESVKIAKRQSEIRAELAALARNEQPCDDELRSMSELDTEYTANETRYRAVLVAEDEERREAKEELETRSDKEFAELIENFELRQVALHLDEGREINGPTAEVVSELRAEGGYQGVPVPWQALETRAGETIASGTPDPVSTRPITDRIFADAAAVRMGARIVNIGTGALEYPVTTSAVTAGWAASETGDVAAPVAYETTDRPLTPDHTLGVQMKITRKSLKQSGAALEQAVRRDMNGAIGEAMDSAVFLGSGATGQPTGVIAGAAAFGITQTAIDATPSWAAFRGAVTRFMIASAANSPNAVRLLVRPEVFDTMDDTLIAGTDVSEWDRMLRHIPAANIVLSPNAAAAPAGSPTASTAVLTTLKNGVPPIWVGTWGAIDMIRDPFTDAASGALRLTALATMDVTISRPAQIEILTGLE